MKAHVEPSRVREQGTVVTLPDSGEKRIAAVQAILDRGQYAKIDGVMVDHFSASAIMAVYRAISAENQAKYREMPIAKMASIAFKLLKK